MAEFLTTTGVSFRLEEIIKNAHDRLVIISPFLRINERIKELLEDKDRLKIDVRVIYGKSELRPEENNWLAAMTSIRTSFCKNLHAKCYLNEGEALLTSMNLYEFSQVHNHEMGILVSKAEDGELYEQIRREANRIERISETIQVTVAPVEPDEDSQQGFCIRCKATISANPEQPYCSRCFSSWNRYKNEAYAEKYCHLCGKEHETTKLKPVCRACYHKYKDVLKFAAS